MPSAAELNNRLSKYFGTHHQLLNRGEFVGAMQAIVDRQIGTAKSDAVLKVVHIGAAADRQALAGFAAILLIAAEQRSDER